MDEGHFARDCPDRNSAHLNLEKAGVHDRFRREGFIPANIKNTLNDPTEGTNADIANDTVLILQPPNQGVLASQSTMDNNASGVPVDVVEFFFSVLVDGKANSTEVELLVFTWATTYLMKADVFCELETPARLLKYNDRQKTADGRQDTVIGRAIRRLELGFLDDEIYVSVVHDLQPQMILGLRTLKKHHCSNDLYSNQQRTGTRESTTVPIRLSNPKGVAHYRKVAIDTPLVMVKKKDGSTRFCVDYRKLNDVTIKDAFPISKIDQIFDALRGAHIFSSLDLVGGYWRIPVAPEHRQKTGFLIPDGGL